MTYDKLSRALRYYYTKGIISKVRLVAKKSSTESWYHGVLNRLNITEDHVVLNCYPKVQVQLFTLIKLQYNNNKKKKEVKTEPTIRHWIKHNKKKKVRSSQRSRDFELATTTERLQVGRVRVKLSTRHLEPWTIPSHVCRFLQIFRGTAQKILNSMLSITDSEYPVKKEQVIIPIRRYFWVRNFVIKKGRLNTVSLEMLYPLPCTWTSFNEDMCSRQAFKEKKCEDELRKLSRSCH